MCFAVVTARVCAADATFSPGAFIIDMGQPSQTPANALKPYGLIYRLVVSNQVVVNWAINPSKITDKNPAVTVEGIDFVLNGKAYRGGPFIIPAEFVDPGVTNLIATWRAKGVVIDGPITNSFTAPVDNQITSFPNVVLDSVNGNKLVAAFYEPAEVPASSYHLGDPRDLGICDDLYGMPHGDPESWDATTKATFLNFILRGGSFWAACHSVSAMEGLLPTYAGLNFLSTTSLVPWNRHDNKNTVPFAYNTNDPSIWRDSLMQFIGKVDLALQGGSEEIYVPDSRGWAPHAKVAVFDRFYADSGTPWISHNNPQMAAADVVFGRAYNNTNYGLVMYVSSHRFQADGLAQNAAVGRMYGNMLLQVGIRRRPRVQLNAAITSLRVGGTTQVSASISGNGGPYAIQWVSSDGTFANPNSTNTTFTAFANAATGPSVIRATISDSCNTLVFNALVIDLLPATGPALFKTASWTNSPGPVQAGDQIDYQIKLANYTNDVPFTSAQISDSLPPNTGYKAASATPALSSGPDPLVWTLGSSSPNIPGVVGAAVTNTLSATTNAFDTYLDNNNKGRNFGGATNLILSGPNGQEKRALVRFNLAAIPTNATVFSAGLTLSRIGGSATAPRNVSIHRLTNDWTENTLNNANGEASWNRRKTGVNWTTSGGDFVAAGEQTNIVGTANVPYTWDVTRAISNAVAAPNAATTNGFLLRYNMSRLPNDSLIFGSSENAAGNGPKLVLVYAVGLNTITRITTSPYRLIGSQSALPTIDVTMQVTVIGNQTNLTVTPPVNLTIAASGGAIATKQAGYPSPASAIVPAGGGTITFTYKYNLTALGTAPGTLRFMGRPANAGGATYADGTSEAILTVPTFNYSVLVNAPLPPKVQRIPNTATFSDAQLFQLNVNAVTSPPVYVPINNSNPVIGVAKTVNSIINHGNGTYTVTFDFAVTNLGSVTVSNVQVGDDLNTAFVGQPLSGVSMTTTPNLTGNPVYNGISNTNLLAGTDVLTAGAGGRVTLSATVTPGSTLTYSNQAVVSATDISGTILTSDLSDQGTNPDPNGDGDPSEAGEDDATSVTFTESPALEVTKTLVSSVKNTNGTFTVTYSITVANLGDVNLSGVQVNDRLASALPAPATFTVDNVSSAAFTVNGAYNGNSNSNLLAAAQTLAVGAQGLINLAVTVAKNGSASASFINQANASAVSPASQVVTNSSTATAMLEAPAITVTKQVTALVPNGTNFSVTVRIDAVNTGDVALQDVQVTDDLDEAFSGALSFTVTSQSATGLTLNTNYDGVSDLNLLVGTNFLGVGATGTVFLTARVVPELGTIFANRAIGSGTSTNVNGQTVVGTSQPAPITPAVVQGALYLDRNTNGVFDAGDDAIPYVDILITTVSNTTVTVSSDALGHFNAFVPAGSTTVNVKELDPQFPTNATLTVGSTDPTTIIVPAGGSATVDTGYVLPVGRGIVSGYVFLDNAGDGAFDADDSPIVNVDVRVIDKNNVTNTVATDSHGYFLRVVPAGQALVDIVTTDPDFPAGKVLTIDDFNNGSDPTLLTVPDGGMATDDTGFITPNAGTGLAMGFVFLDRNTNGVFDVADTPLSGLPVAITDTNGTTITVTTDPSGFYSLIVNPGLTVVDVVTSDPGFPTGATLTVGATDPTTVNVPDGGTARDDNGYLLPSGIGIVRGVAYVDNNLNGLYELGVDTPIPNLTVIITETNGSHTALVTDSDGFFSHNVTNGITIVAVDTADPDFPAGLNLTTDAQGEGSNPTAVFVPSGGAATDNTGFTLLNLIPFAANDVVSTERNFPVSGNVLTNDGLGDLPIAGLTIITNSSHGVAVLSLDGSFTYTPSLNYLGPDSFVYKLCDANGDCATATVTITVSSTNTAPTAVNDTFTGLEDTTLNIPAAGVLTNDVDIDGDAMTALLVGTTAHGTLTLNANGSFTYTPTTNYNGPDTFTYRARDGQATGNVATVTINITPVNDAPVSVNDAYSSFKNISLNISLPGVLGNDTDVETNALSALLVSNPTNGTLTLNANGSFLYTPASNYVGSDVFTYRAYDSGATGNVATVTLSVLATNMQPIANAQSVSTAQNTPTAINLTGSDPDGDPLTFNIATSPGNGTLSGLNTNTGAVTYTPNPSFLGTDSFTFRVSDGTTNSVPATVTIDVGALADIAVFKSGSTLGSTGTNLSFTITVTNSGPSTASNVMVFDQLPASYTLVSAVPAPASTNGGVLSWPLFNLAAFASSNFSLTVTPMSGGVFTNIAYATNSTPDPDPTNNNGTKTNSQVITFVQPLADVAVIKTGSASARPRRPT
jgi:uncharacterized repeat protein (TIGR01451 family)